MEDILLIYNFFKRNGNRIVLLTLIWIMFTLMFVQDVYGRHYDEVRIPNNGIVSFYDFEGSHTGDLTIPDKAGKNNMKVVGFPRIVDGTAGEGWYSNLVEVVGANAFSFLEIPYIPEFNSKSFSIGFYGGFCGLDSWDLHKNYYWSWGDNLAMCITTEEVDGDELYTTNLRFGNKTYSFFTHAEQFAYYHYVVVYDGTNRILMGYWDGQQQIRDTDVSRPSVSGSPIRFATDNNLNHNFSGRFDEIAIYNRPLTPIEVTRYYGGVGLEIEPKGKLACTWGEVKR